MTIFDQLTQIQRDFGYTTGNINAIALLGLFGEAGEVLKEVILIDQEEDSTHNDLIHTAVSIAQLVDNLKKQIRNSPQDAPLVFIGAEDGGKNFDLELADTLYYLNLLALNRGHDLDYYAQLSIDKVKDKVFKGKGFKTK
jgi:hypothetical protein